MIKLALRGLKISESKREEYTIKKPTVIIVGETVNCLVAFQLYKMTLKEEKVLAINAANKLKHLFLNKDVTNSGKTKTFKSYITSIFLYSSE